MYRTTPRFHTKNQATEPIYPGDGGRNASCFLKLLCARVRGRSRVWEISVTIYVEVLWCSRMQAEQVVRLVSRRLGGVSERNMVFATWVLRTKALVRQEFYLL